MPSEKNLHGGFCCWPALSAVFGLLASAVFCFLARGFTFFSALLSDDLLPRPEFLLAGPESYEPA